MARDPGLGWFDRFAASATTVVSRAPFFAACVLLVVVWAPSFFIFRSVDTWQLIINTITTIITFLLVALLQNSQSRSDHAMHEKLNVIADALADLMQALEPNDPSLRRDRQELLEAVGLEDRQPS